MKKVGFDLKMHGGLWHHVPFAKVSVSPGVCPTQPGIKSTMLSGEL
jgi:hypothetical protein